VLREEQRAAGARLGDDSEQPGVARR
jgi:hypothetical protein